MGIYFFFFSARNRLYPFANGVLFLADLLSYESFQDAGMHASRCIYIPLCVPAHIPTDMSLPRAGTGPRGRGDSLDKSKCLGSKVPPSGRNVSAPAWRFAASRAFFFVGINNRAGQ